MLISIFLSSCEDNIITSSNTPYYIVKSIRTIENDTILSRYYCDTDKNYNLYQNSIYFRDTIGKYNIGDKLKAEFIKY